MMMLQKSSVGTVSRAPRALPASLILPARRRVAVRYQDDEKSEAQRRLQQSQYNRADSPFYGWCSLCRSSPVTSALLSALHSKCTVHSAQCSHTTTAPTTILLTTRLLPLAVSRTSPRKHAIAGDFGEDPADSLRAGWEKLKNKWDDWEPEKR